MTVAVVVAASILAACGLDDPGDTPFLTFDQLKSSRFLAVPPLSKVPVLEIGGQIREVDADLEVGADPNLVLLQILGSIELADLKWASFVCDSSGTRVSGYEWISGYWNSFDLDADTGDGTVQFSVVAASPNSSGGSDPDLLVALHDGCRDDVRTILQALAGRSTNGAPGKGP